MGRVRDRGVPRDACNNRSAASCTHPIPENRAHISFLYLAILARLDYTTGAHCQRDFSKEFRVRVFLFFPHFPSAFFIGYH